ELVLRSLARRWHRDEGDLRATLLPRGSPTPSSGAPFGGCGRSGGTASAWGGAGFAEYGKRYRPHGDGDARLDRHRAEGSWGGTDECWTTRWTSRNSSFRHERDDQGVPGRNRGVFHLSSGRGLSLWILTSPGRGSE